MAELSHAEWSRSLGHPHCGFCGTVITSVTGLCSECHGLACRADTTDLVAPDPPCVGYRRKVNPRASVTEGKYGHCPECAFSVGHAERCSLAVPESEETE
jgi:hypothetical protein